MNSDLYISVIVPAYNVSSWIERCVKSILNQTYNKLEIIIINDGSTDDTGKIVDSLAAEDSRIKVIHQNNTGLIKVRERGIAEANGEFIGFVDGDDEIEPEMYEKLLANALKYNADISQCGILYCFYDGRIKPMHGTGNIYVFSRNEGYIELLTGKKMEPSLCNKIYRKQLLNNSCLDETIVNNEDLLRNAVLFAKANITVFEDFCGYHYWRRNESMSNNSRAIEIQENILKARKLILDNTWNEVGFAAEESYAIALISTYNRMIFSKSKQSSVLQKDCITELKKLRPKIYRLSKKTQHRIKAILYARLFYNITYYIHTKRKKKRIQKQKIKLKEIEQ